MHHENNNLMTVKEAAEIIGCPVKYLTDLKYYYPTMPGIVIKKKNGYQGNTLYFRKLQVMAIKKYYNRNRKHYESIRAIFNLL